MTSTDAAPPARPSAIFALGLLTAAAPLSIDMYSPALPVIATEFGSTAASVQLSLTACLLGLGVGQLIAGPIGDRLGRRRPLLIGVALFVVASLGCALAPSVPTLLVLRLAQGVGGAVGIVLARAMVRDLASGRTAVRLYSQMAAFAATVPVFAPVLGAGIIELSGWRAVFVAVASVGLLMLVGVAAALAETHPTERRSSAAPREVVRAFGRTLGIRPFRIWLLVIFFSGATLFAWVSNSPFVVRDLFGLDAVGFSLVFAAIGTGLVAANLVNARLVRRRDPMRLLLLVSLVQVTGVAGVSLATALQVHTWAIGLPLYMLLLAAAVVPFGFIVPTAQALAMSVIARFAGSASALLGVSAFTAGALVSPLSRFGAPATVMCATMLLAAPATFLLLWAARASPIPHSELPNPNER